MSSSSARKSKRASQGGSIFDRLTDASQYTGAHKHRFGKDGQGLGKAGRIEEDKVTDLSALTRPSLHTGKSRRSTGTAGIDLSNVQKFGTQAAVAKKATFYRNGDVNHKGVSVTLTKAINSYDKLLKKLSKDVAVPTGPCLKIFEVVEQTDGNTHKRVKDLESIHDGGVYIACGAESVNKVKYPKKLGAPKSK